VNVRILLLTSVVTATLGQILFKKGMSLMGAQAIRFELSYMFKTIVNILTSPHILAGLFFYAFSTLLWLMALSKTTLNYAYPFTALTFLLVMSASYFVFSEALPLNRIIGAAVICVGIIISSFR